MNFFRRADCHFLAVSGSEIGRKWMNENLALNVNFSQSRHPPPVGGGIPLCGGAHAGFATGRDPPLAPKGELKGGSWSSKNQTFGARELGLARVKNRIFPNVSESIQIARDRFCMPISSIIPLVWGRICGVRVGGGHILLCVGGGHIPPFRQHWTR